MDVQYLEPLTSLISTKYLQVHQGFDLNKTYSRLYLFVHE